MTPSKLQRVFSRGAHLDADAVAPSPKATPSLNRAFSRGAGLDLLDAAPQAAAKHDAGHLVPGAKGLAKPTKAYVQAPQQHAFTALAPALPTATAGN